MQTVRLVQNSFPAFVFFSDELVNGEEIFKGTEGLRSKVPAVFCLETAKLPVNHGSIPAEESRSSSDDENRCLLRRTSLG